jgi:hypothetical protein
MRIRSKILPAFLIAVAGTLAPSAASAQGGSLFEGLSGSWSGGGTVRWQNGNTERLRCDAAYKLAPSGGTLHQDLRCKSDSYRVNLKTTVVTQGSAISGTWVETVKSVEGRISGQATPGQIRARAQAPGITVTFSVSTKGDQQSISLRSQGEDSTTVSIVLRRSAVRALAQ